MGRSSCGGWASRGHSYAIPVVEISQAASGVPRSKPTSMGRAGNRRPACSSPCCGGELQVSKGASMLQLVAWGARLPMAGSSRWRSSKLVREVDFQQPLVLFSVRGGNNDRLALRQAIPNFSYVRLNDLRLDFGPICWCAPPWPPSRRGGCHPHGPIDRTLSARGVGLRAVSGRAEYSSPPISHPRSRRAERAVFHPVQGGCLPDIARAPASQTLEHWQ